MDYLIVGAGLFGAVCARELKRHGHAVRIIEKRNHIAGNAFTHEQDGIQVHKYGAHIFHTNNEQVWNYVQQFARFNRFTNSPLALHQGKLYNLPFNMNTFYQLWGTRTPAEAKAMIASQRSELANHEPQNLEEQAISLVGRDVYEILIKGYTEKQWGRAATELPAFIINRLPVRFTFDNNYFSDRYQGIPEGGYTAMIANMLEGIDVQLETDFLANREYWLQQAGHIIYTGPIDQFFDNCYGPLAYRSLRFEEETLDIENFQGNAVINYTERHIPFTRIIEHKHFDYVDSPKTVITREYPADWENGDEPYYPINDATNMELYQKYRKLANQQPNITFGGRLAEYKYYDMHQVIAAALHTISTLVEQ